MKNAFLFSIIALASQTCVCHAGSAPESTSTINGYFLGSTSGTYISVNASEEYIRDIESTCKKKSAIWALGYKSPLKCVGTKYIKEGGNGPVIEVIIEGLKESKETQSSILFSTTPFPEKAWIKRESTPEEATSVTKYLNRPKNNLEIRANGNIRRFLFNLRPTIIESANNTIYLVPWATTVDDTDSVNNEFIVLERSEDTFLYNGSFSGKITDFIDITGDGVPEIKVNQDCDGTCEYIAEIKGSFNTLVSIFNH